MKENLSISEINSSDTVTASGSWLPNSPEEKRRIDSPNSVSATCPAAARASKPRDRRYRTEGEEGLSVSRKKKQWPWRWR